MNVLHIVASPRADRSVSREIGTYAANAFGGTVTTVDVHAENVPFLTSDAIALNYGFGEYAALSPEGRKAVDLQKKYIGQILAADAIVISAPMWNFSVPAALKAWIDLIIKVNVTFSLDAEGYHGLVKNVKKAVIVTTAGGAYENTAYAPYDHLNGYLQGVLAFVGITESKVFRVEGVNMAPDSVAAKSAEAKKAIDAYAKV